MRNEGNTLRMEIKSNVRVSKVKYFLFYFFLSFFLSTTVLYFFKGTRIRKTKKRIEFTENSVLTIEREVLLTTFQNIISDLVYLKGAYEFDKEEGISDSGTAEKWELFLAQKTFYENIKLFDAKGKVLIDVEPERLKSKKSARDFFDKEEIPLEKLQGYFQNFQDFESGYTYISGLDLTVKYRNYNSERSATPMITCAVVLLDSQQNENGYIVLSYNGERLLRKMSVYFEPSYGDLFLVNSSGYNWRYDDQWHFIPESEVEQRGFAECYPDSWKIIKENSQGDCYVKNNLVVFSDVSLSKKVTNEMFYEKNVAVNSSDWKLITYVSRDNKVAGRYLGESDFWVIMRLLFGNTASLSLILFGSFFLSFLLTKNKINRDKIDFFSKYDDMTKTFNRRAGLLKLEEEIQFCRSKNRNLFACYIDVNGLKEVNDNLGHESGNELILTIITIIKRYLKKNDFVVRLGGDEFLLICIRKIEEEMEELWKAVMKDLERINETKSRKYFISASHGIVKYRPEYSVSYFLNLADDAMYKEKREVKKRIKIIR